MPATNVFELEARARQRVDQMAWDYYASGANAELTLSRNQRAFDDIELHYRVLVDVSERDTATEVLGQRIAMPLMIAPTAFHRLACDDGELATARAAGEAGTVMILSTLSNTRVEDVVAAATGPVWFQLYVYRDRAATEGLVERVKAAGCQALVLTVDAPLLGKRERDARNQFQLPDGLSIENMLPAGYADMPTGAKDSGLAAYFADMIDPSLSWKDLDWLRSIADMPVLIKGVVRPDDARRAVDHGAAGVVVSNHGGRQLDTAPATIDVLPRIADTVGDDLELYLDGGIRRGTDVIKALAYGAKAALIGRPILWGLGAAGQAGVTEVLDLFRTEIDLAMALCGCPTVKHIDRTLVARRP